MPNTTKKLQLWQVKIPCEYIGNVYNDARVITYYVHAETADDAEDKAESWLPDHYDVVDDDFDTTPYVLFQDGDPLGVKRRHADNPNPIRRSNMAFEDQPDLSSMFHR
jgi:hypothetical protein